MALAAGVRLGPYEIGTPLGAGGMGEVYRAIDTRLRRAVAVKVVTGAFALDPDRLRRFQQEALAAAALNHPNILGVYDIGSDNGVAYIATELVNGDTLSSTIQTGPVPVRTLLDIAVQIADGMACAHAAQIVHRDLKPANVMIATDGRVKILDFGLAKQVSAVSSGDQTLTVHQTEPGMVVGTVSYMSPEQARGKPIDHRSDQFSFGLVLYEMATGRKPFDKPESVQTMAAIISEEAPPIDGRIPAPLRWLIDRCLAKDPAGRYDSTRDLFFELRSLRDHLSEASSELADVPSLATARVARRWPRWYVPAAFALGGLATLSAMVLRPRPDVPDQSAYRYTPFSFEPGGQSSPVWSPDGKAVAYAARQEVSGVSQIFIRYLEAATPLQLTHTTDNAFPLAWNPDGTRILLKTERQPVQISSIATVGGEPELLMTLPEGGGRTGSIAISPDNATVAVFRRGEDQVESVWITSPLGSPPRKYSPDPFATKDVYNQPMMRFSPDGKHIMLFLNAGRPGEEAWLLDYPPTNAAGARRIFSDLQGYGGTPTFAWMPDSRHLVMSLQPAPNALSQLWLVDSTSGERHALTSGTTGSAEPAVSPDGEKLILTETSDNYDIVSVTLTAATPSKLIATERNELMPSWAANQPALAYVSDRNGPNEIWLHRSDNPDRSIVSARDFPTGTTQWFMAPAISPDGKRVIYDRIETGSAAARLWISGVAGGTSIRLTNDTAVEFPGSWSPDGAWFVYHSLRGGKAHLMKVKTSGQAPPIVLLDDVKDPNVPSWSPSGNWIAFGEHLISPDGKIVKPLGEHHSAHYMFSADGQSLYGIRPDGQRELLFRLDLASGAETIIGDVGRDFRPDSNLEPSIRFSLAPDGKSFIYSIGKYKRNLWMLDGFASKMGIRARLGF